LSRPARPPGPQKTPVLHGEGGSSTAEPGDLLRYTVSGIEADTVDIALVPAADVNWDDNGQVSFDGSNPGGSGNVYDADADDVSANITVVDGDTTGLPAEYVDGHQVSGNSVSFSVRTNGAEDFVPVVFTDSIPAAGDNNLQLNPNGTPREDFGVAQATRVVPDEAADGEGTIGAVDYVNKAENLFHDREQHVLLRQQRRVPPRGGRERLRSHDGEFEQRLSVGDSVDGTYRNNPANQSSFTLDDTAPAAPDSVTATPNTDEGGVTVTVTETDDANLDSFRIYRAAANQNITPLPSDCNVDAADYTAIATVANDATKETESYDDTSAAEGEEYCYTASAIDGTDEGPRSNPSAVVEGAEQATQSAPESRAPLR
jgi:hypothetical protein